MNRLIPIIIGLLLVLWLSMSTMFVVDQRQYAIVFSFASSATFL